MSDVVESKVVIIGAGPAGLAMGGALRTRGIPFEIVEKSQQVGTSWRNHYARLHLHTVKQHSALPWMPFPEHYPTYPAREQVVEYLEEYARRFDLRPHFGHEVTWAARNDRGLWQVETDQDQTFTGEQLVVATGYNCEPKIPDWPGRDDFEGEFLHARDYDDGRDYRGQRVLVVGFGNSGGEIAIDLFEFGAQVTMAVRSPVHVVPRDALGIPAQLNSIALSRLPIGIADRIGTRLSRMLTGDLSRWGLRRPEIGPVRQVVEHGKIPLIDIGTIDLIKQGAIDVVPSGIETFNENRVRFDNGAEREFDVVLAATGYRPRLDRFLDKAEQLTDDRGYPVRHGASSPGSEPFFVGYRNPLTGALKDIADEARAIATRLST